MKQVAMVIVHIEVIFAFAFVCAISALASMEELTCVIFMKEMNPYIQSVFSLLRE